MGCKIQQRIRGDCSSAGPWQQFLQDLPADLLHPADLITPVLLQDSQGTALHSSSTHGTPQAPRAPITQGRRKEGSEPGVEVKPTSVQEMDFAGGFVSTLHSTNPGTELLARLQQNRTQDRASQGQGTARSFHPG